VVAVELLRRFEGEGVGDPLDVKAASDLLDDVLLDKADRVLQQAVGRWQASRGQDPGEHSAHELAAEARRKLLRCQTPLDLDLGVLAYIEVTIRRVLTDRLRRDKRRRERERPTGDPPAERHPDGDAAFEAREVVQALSRMRQAIEQMAELRRTDNRLLESFDELVALSVGRVTRDEVEALELDRCEQHDLPPERRLKLARSRVHTRHSSVRKALRQRITRDMKLKIRADDCELWLYIVTSLLRTRSEAQKRSS
jgi:DNA-directed RNA polymerase specialized sigma24 family protein